MTLLFTVISLLIAGGMRSQGKIYVVLAVIVLVWIGLALFIAYLDRRVRRIEKSSLHGEKQKNS